MAAKRTSAFSRAVREAQEADAPAPVTPTQEAAAPAPTPPASTPSAMAKGNYRQKRISLYLYPQQERQIRRLLREYEDETDIRPDQQDILRWLINRATLNLIREGEAMDEEKAQ